jgi:phenylacetate-coenzyme A ligase PaaK-like adenylate-forming protein
MSAGIGVVANPSDVVLVALPDGRPNSQSDLLIRGVIKLGANPIAAGFDWETEAFFNAVKQNRPAVIFGYTSRIFRMTQELQSTHDLASMGVRALFLASEYLPAPMRSNLQKIWNCRVHTHYGLTEMGLGVAIECSAKEGYHFNEADLLLEIVDPKTGEAAKLGEEGEIVFTTLSREAMPLIRYRTHDISRIIPGPCSCGADGLLRFGAVRKRLESILQLQSGDELYPSLLDDLLFEVSGLVDYQAVLERHGGKEKLCVKIEMANPQRNSKSEIIHRLSEAPAIARAIALGTMQIPELDFVNPGALKIASRAKKLISDQR